VRSALPDPTVGRSALPDRLLKEQDLTIAPREISGSSVLIVLIFQENAKEVMPVFQNLLNFSNQNHTFVIALI